MVFDRGQEIEDRAQAYGVIAAVLQHMHRRDGAAVRFLLEQEGVFDTPNAARLMLVTMGEMLLDMLALRCNDDHDAVERWLEMMIEASNGLRPPEWDV